MSNTDTKRLEEARKLAVSRIRHNIAATADVGHTARRIAPQRQKDTHVQAKAPLSLVKC